MSDTQDTVELSPKRSNANPTTQEEGGGEQSVLVQLAEASQPQAQVGTDGTQPPSIRRSQRSRTLMERGKALQDAKLNDLQREFDHKYKRWKYHINGLKRAFKNNDEELILEVVSTINSTQSEVDRLYVEIRNITSPETEVRRKNDTCLSITNIANEKAQRFLNEDPDNIPWPESDSVFEATVSSIISATSSREISVSKSQFSHDSLQRKQDAAAEVAATQEVIKIMKTQHQYEEEIRKLEAEDQWLTAEREAQEKEREAEKQEKELSSSQKALIGK